MLEGQSKAPGSPVGELTLDSAASVFENLLSEEEDTQSRDPKPAKSATAQANEDDEPEPKGEESDPDEQSDPEPESGEDDEDSGEDDEDSSAVVPQPPRMHRVKIDGVEHEVTEEELHKGYSRNADYTRKTQELAEQRKAQAAEFEAVRVERQEYAAKLKELYDALKSQAPEEPNWDKLAAEHPDEFPRVHAQWQIYKDRLAAVAAEGQRAQQKVAEDTHKAYQAQMVEESKKLVEAVPAWKDEKVRKADKGKLIPYIKAMGYTDQDLANIRDHRVLVIAHKARLYDEAQKNLPAVRERISAVKTATPGTGSTNRKPVTDLTRAKQRLAKTGQLRDAATTIEHLLED